MLHAHRLPARRPGFTLIELMIAIAIIATMVALLLSGISAVLRAQKRTQTLVDISKMDNSLKAAGRRYGDAKALPGALLLCNNIDIYRNPQTYVSSGTITAAQAAFIPATKDVLIKMFGPRLISNGLYVYWDGSNNPNGVALLEGQYCLVFYLGGIANPSTSPVTMRGFANNPVNPSDFQNTTDRIGTFYQFDAVRLVPNPQYPGFYCYLDPYGTPYAYFGRTGGPNTYIDYCPSLLSYTPNAPAGSTTLIHYVSNPGNAQSPAMNANSFQIISAGRDQKFGWPGSWSQLGGTTDLYGRDDLSNFSQGVLADGSS
jgi:prepilin-type N-terminal cleavage/methylation domain-containing protein